MLHTFNTQAPISAVFGAMTDFNPYPLWVSGLKDVLDETPPGSDTPRIRFSAGTMGLSVSYTLEYTLEIPTRLSWVSVAGWVHTVCTIEAPTLDCSSSLPCRVAQAVPTAGTMPLLGPLVAADAVLCWDLGWNGAGRGIIRHNHQQPA